MCVGMGGCCGHGLGGGLGGNVGVAGLDCLYKGLWEVLVLGLVWVGLGDLSLIKDII